MLWKSSHRHQKVSSFEYISGYMSAVVHLTFLVVSNETMRIRTIVLMNRRAPIWQLDIYMLEFYVCEYIFFYLIYVLTYGKRKVVRIVLFYSFVILNFTPLNLFTIYPFYCVAILHTIQGCLCGKMVDFFCLSTADNGDFYCIYYYFVYKDWKDMHLVLFYFKRSYFDLFDDVHKTLWIRHILNFLIKKLICYKI